MMYADYLRVRLDYLCKSDVYVSDKLKEDGDKLCRRVDSGQLNEQSPILEQSLCEFGMVTLTLRYVMLMAACTFLEEAIKFMSQRLIEDYDDHLRGQKDGSWLHRHLRMLASCKGLDLAPIEHQKAMFEDIIRVRNAIAHGWGKVTACKSAPQIHQIASRYDWLGVNKEGFIDLQDHAVPEALAAAIEIVEHVLGLPDASSLKL